jgi:hypothetical protein
MAGPQLWVAVAVTTIQMTILIWGAIRFPYLLNFCRSTNSSGAYSAIKNILVLLFYSYAPAAAVGITFTWVAHSFGWSSGYFFAILAFIPIALMITVMLVTKNDISNMVDVERKARTKLPAQGPPAPFIAVVPNSGPFDDVASPRQGGWSPPGAAPVVPIQQDTPVKPRPHEL